MKQSIGMTSGMSIIYTEDFERFIRGLEVID